MQQYRTSAVEKAVRGNPGWYSVYSAAMLESNRDRTLSRIDHAQRAIQNRVAELRVSPASGSREITDLSDALNHLAILLQNFSDESGRILWD